MVKQHYSAMAAWDAVTAGRFRLKSKLKISIEIRRQGPILPIDFGKISEVVMGGMGSGRRWHFGARSTINSFRSIDVRRWQRENLLTPGNYFGWSWLTEDEVTGSIRVRVEHSRLRLIYKTKSPGEEWQDKDYPVILDSTECNFGGSRKWFICPARGCGRRVAMLYGGAVFVCRHCNQLAYPSQNEDASDRATRQAERIRRKDRKSVV